MDINPYESPRGLDGKTSCGEKPVRPKRSQRTRKVIYWAFAAMLTSFVFFGGCFLILLVGQEMPIFGRALLVVAGLGSTGVALFCLSYCIRQAWRSATAKI